jgi:nickel transport system ATP-binding protein
MNLLELRDITKTYRHGRLFGAVAAARVLDGVNLVIKAGTCVGLLGESGCGKSTAGRIITGLERPSSGTVYYCGADLKTMDRAARRNCRRNCQVVFQNALGAVNPRWRAWEIIGEPLSYFERLPREALRNSARGLLARVGLGENSLDKLPSQFSGGELQRVCIARALSLTPRFILLDEAVSALDMYNQSLVLDLITSLKRETGAAFLFISHDIRVLLKTADSLAVMDRGKIALFAPDITALERPGAVYHETLAKLARAAPPSPQPPAVP